MRETLASRVWDWCAGQPGEWSVRHVTEALGASANTVAHYVRFWVRKGAVQWVRDEPAPVGRPVAYYRTVAGAARPPIWCVGKGVEDDTMEVRD